MTQNNTTPNASKSNPAVSCKPFSTTEITRLYRNSPEMHGEVKSLAAFGRLVKLVEAVHRITS